ncbi:hypothetical protein [Cerasicoccus frondis]|uniref:hypothetical protein n=1 Tax=Cerasicoccus frondis TaxID=490090 RepID=UPI002852A71E|nr:hypothetical protein [Cerasicoccus frondis]
MIQNVRQFALLTLLVCSFGAGLLNARTWTHQDGRTFEGDLLRVEGDVAVIQRDLDQQVFRVKMEVLSSEDQDYIENSATSHFFADFVKSDLPFLLLIALLIPLELALVYYAGKLFRLDSWTFGRSVLWQIYYAFINVVGNVLGGICFFIYASIEQANGTSIDSLLQNAYHPFFIFLSIIIYLISLYLNAIFLRIGMIRTFFFILCCSLIVGLGFAALVVISLLAVMIAGG